MGFVLGVGVRLNNESVRWVARRRWWMGMEAESERRKDRAVRMGVGVK